MPRRSSLVAYFSLTYLLAWAVWLPAGALTPASLNPTVRGLFFLPGTFAPGIVALWLTFRHEGAAGVRALVDRLFRSQVAARWYVFAVFFVTATRLAAALVYRLVEGAWPAFNPLPWYLLLMATAISTPFQAGEEIGWRGYALPRLQARFGLGPASVLLGGLWAAWHLPLFYVPGTDSAGQPFLPYLLAVTAISVAMALLYWRSGGSLLLTMIMHAGVNNMAAIVPSSSPGAVDPMAPHASRIEWLTIAFLWAAAVGFLVWMRRAGAQESTGTY
jgi:membrane protease YdiL (CAAX protease family)